MAGFVVALDPVNRIAEQSPGFVWRVRSSESHGATVLWDGSYGLSPGAFTLRRRFEPDGLPTRRRGRSGVR